MFELFWAMMKEEWRLHSTMFGNISFALFPVLIFLITFMGSFLIPMMETAIPTIGIPTSIASDSFLAPLLEMTIPTTNLSLMIHGSYLMLGIMVGGFGLLGNEVMNRRFGQMSLLAYAARSLPLSEREIFGNFVIKDTVYYFILWVLPFAFGYIAASPFTGVPLAQALLLLLTLALAFLFGLCGIFFLSIIYTRSKPVLWVLLLALAVGWGGFVAMTGINPALLFPPILLFAHFTWMNFLLTSVFLAFFFGISIWLFNPESVGSEKIYKDSFSPLMKRFSFLPYPDLFAKDIIDLRRSGSIVGHAIFSFIFPLAVIWFFLSLLEPYLPSYGLLFIFVLITGVIGSTIYTWVTMFDTPEAYGCLPIAVSTLIDSKLTTFTIFQLLPLVFISVATILAAETAYLLPAIVLTLSISFYTVAVMVWLCGLYPNTLIYDVKVMIRYLVIVGIVLVLFMALAFMDPYLTLVSVFLGVPAWVFIRRGKRYWDSVEMTGF
jgi:hypothetical protein